jgi:hypothetical protein
MEFFLLF